MRKRGGLCSSDWKTNKATSVWWLSLTRRSPLYGNIGGITRILHAAALQAISVAGKWGWWFEAPTGCPIRKWGRIMFEFELIVHARKMTFRRNFVRDRLGIRVRVSASGGRVTLQRGRSGDTHTRRFSARPPVPPPAFLSAIEPIASDTFPWLVFLPGLWRRAGLSMSILMPTALSVTVHAIHVVQLTRCSDTIWPLDDGFPLVPYGLKMEGPIQEKKTIVDGYLFRMHTIHCFHARYGTSTSQYCVKVHHLANLKSNDAIVTQIAQSHYPLPRAPSLGPMATDPTLCDKHLFCLLRLIRRSQSKLPAGRRSARFQLPRASRSCACRVVPVTDSDGKLQLRCLQRPTSTIPTPPLSTLSP
ncbi:uncharacterized protein CLUP02_07389 [Colletotrichum lupini]|uniref:Uncharacterized protein n=1 Tax=Colletotrichum lupini TaxID=145971 RepID=A0A9Q8SRI5_9PEZI|nr:uncharacterized protein CLUP02_07389 [Colletotrichum lupini]UQC81903.1 hypothetical protein CLUP02_07389 [Colletotrichum lupini]